MMQALFSILQREINLQDLKNNEFKSISLDNMKEGLNTQNNNKIADIKPFNINLLRENQNLPQETQTILKSILKSFLNLFYNDYTSGTNKTERVSNIVEFISQAVLPIHSEHYDKKCGHWIKPNAQQVPEVKEIKPPAPGDEEFREAQNRINEASRINQQIKNNEKNIPMLLLMK